MAMSLATASRIEPLRPAIVRSHPVRIPRVFDDPDKVLRLIAEGGPYSTTAKYHNLGETLGAKAASAPWFKTHLNHTELLENPRWINAAREAFGADIVRPLTVALNLNAATPLGVPHLDLPRFRGFGAPAMPVWLLLNMAHSGLFHDWMLPFASGLCWFNRDESGAFEYWPDGLNAPSMIEPAPMWNRGVVGDNEFMWHRTGAIGTDEEQQQVRARMRYDNTLHALPDGGWEMRNNDEVLCRFAPGRIRISLLWKANVFTNESHLASFEDQRLNLTIEKVVDLYIADLGERGHRVSVPSDPLSDVNWRELLQSVYAPEISHLA